MEQAAMMGLGEELLGTIRKLAIASEWAITMSKGGFPIIDNLERNPPSQAGELPAGHR